MSSNEKIYNKETLNTITELIDDGIKKISVIMRHSARFFPEEPAMEPFMGLTERGKDFSLKLGEELPLTPYPQFFSSHFGRCIETSAIIDKGYSKTHNRFNDHNQLCRELSPFYIKDIKQAVTMVQKIKAKIFIRKWFNREISSDIMLDPEEAADIIAKFMVTRLNALNDGEIAICLSHDWNLFPLKEYKLGLKHEECGVVGFLESVIIFEKNGKHYITNYQKEPQELK
ncbi:MAG: histidine phosphatase family protein [Thermodesulfobacteriota bacterium]|nr:histidine phosphatase family protein [Thermodesulfobacteriota bacterium]